MDRGRRQSEMLAAKNSKLYLDLKDIVRENALCFLPAKSLLKCRGVCRDWKLLISSPFFVHNQSLSFRRISGFFCQTPGSPPSFVSVDPKACGVPEPSLKFLPFPVHIRSSSNGLLCCHGLTGDRAYYICNPITKQWKILPKPNADHGPDPAVVLVFEPSLLNFVAEYKLVCAIPSTDFDNAIEFEIYSSKAGTWKNSAEISFAEQKPNPRTGIYVNGVVYWKGTVGCIFALDLVKDRLVITPGYYYQSGVNSSLGTVNGKICTANPNGSAVTITVLPSVLWNTNPKGSHYETVQNKITYRINLGGQALGWFGYHNSRSLYFVGDDMIVGSIGKKMYSYDIKNKEATVLSTSPPDSNTWIVPYVNTLVEL